MLDARFIVRAALVSALAVGSAAVGYRAWRKPAITSPEIRHLGDGTTASLGPDTRLLAAAGFPSRREFSLDGEALLKVPAMGRPLIVRTRLMHLEVRGSSTLAITARSRETGEQVEVLSGEVIVSKNYASSYRVPDDLHGGEMSMVNETIDLMEKEHLDASSLASIRERADRLD
ncbi:MAG TPA: FecR domain-containing protein [Steroidobacteraceae bacterium]|nr:FecR domain-containing protein [Steroidobacteraceae bacterium]